jgi:hypothetical protein
MKSLVPLFIEAYTSANYNGHPAKFGKEKSLVNVFQASVILPYSWGNGEDAKKICKIDDVFVEYSFDKLKAALKAKGVILPEPKN